MYNTKEVTLAPLVFLAWQTALGRLSGESLIYLIIGFGVMIFFSAMLGLHFGLTYGSSRQAIANSLATMFFLFIGIFLCMLLIVQAQAFVAVQLPASWSSSWEGAWGCGRR